MNKISDIKAWCGRFFTKRCVFTALTTFLLCFGRFLYSGFKYYPQLDDYIQYHNLATGGDGFAVINELGLLAARPLAGIFDIFVWSGFWGNMIWAVLIISILYTAAGLLIYSILKRYFKLSYLFVIIFILFPSGFEGVYWLSASTRIVMGLFFAALSGKLLDTYLRERKSFQWILYAILQLISFLFYEQTLIFSAVFAVVILFIGNRKSKKDFLLLCSILINGAIFFIITKLAGKSAYYGDRGANIFSEVLFGGKGAFKYYLKEVVPLVFEQFVGAFVKAPIVITGRGFVNGMTDIYTSGKAIYAVFVPAITGMAVFMFGEKSAGDKEVEVNKKYWWKLVIVAGALFILPVAPLLILVNPWISLRTTVVTYTACALVVDALIQAIPKETLRKNAAVMLGGVLCFVLLISGASELRNYHKTTIHDERFIKNFSDAVEVNNIPYDAVIGLAGVQPAYIVTQNYFHNEHVHGITESSWAISGAFEARNGYAVNVVLLQEEEVDADYIFLVDSVLNFELVRSPMQGY